ncbi:hypothetical protein [Marinicella meishanensis]|uniref:hypothetical protein n=1 Tax=Marinicella meishanensis TaxID=2873263 RepID=UPI001CBBF18D|nr:hypothetical protein [Marinicella sp. NBU2979]
MKKLWVFLFILGMGLGSAAAQSFTTGYAALVSFSDRTTARPAGETQEACEENRQRLIDDYLAAHPGVIVLEDRSLPCGPRTSPAPDVDLRAWLEIDIPPYCTSCPLLGPDTFKIFYPDFTAEIKELYYGYKINSYNKELRALQSQYDLAGFEAEVFKLNKELNQYEQ